MFAETLKTLRKSKGLTQIQLAQELKVANGTIGMWETGKREPDFDTLSVLSDYFGVSYDYLLSSDIKKSPPAEAEGGKKQELFNLIDQMNEETLGKFAGIAKVLLQDAEDDQ